MWCSTMNLDDNFVLDKPSDSRRALLQLAMYAQHLGSGNSLFCRTIKAATIKQYVNAAASFLALFGDNPRDYRKDSPTDAHVSPVLTSVYTELSRWEKQPNRREPFTPEMLTDVRVRFAATGCGPDSKVAALADWFQCALFAGFRLSKWAQTAYKSGLEDYQRDRRDDAQALCLRDVRFTDARGAKYTAGEVLQSSTLPQQMQFCFITFRSQKNGQNGEERKFARHAEGEPSVLSRRCSASSSASCASVASMIC